VTEDKVEVGMPTIYEVKARENFVKEVTKDNF
jgi:hypothetical protein